MKASRVWIFAVVAVLGLLLLAPASEAGKGFDDKEVRVGQFGPLTGPAAPWGAVLRGSALRFQLVNDEGGIHGRKIKYFMRDDQYNPAQTVTVIKELVENQDIFAIVGGVAGAGSIAAKDYLTKNKIIWIGPTASARELVFPQTPYLFCLTPLYEDEASIMTKYLVETAKMKKIALMYQNDSYGQAGLAGMRQRLAKYKMKAVAEIPVEPTERDLASHIMKIKNAGPEAVILWVAPTTAVISLKTAATIGFKPQWAGGTPLADYPMMHKISGGLWEGVINTSYVEPPDSSLPVVVKYREAQKKYMPEERWGLFFMGGLLVADPLIDALKKAGKKLSLEAVLKQLNSAKNYKTIGPTINWSKNQHQGVDSAMIWKCGPGGKTMVMQGWTQNELATWKKK
ncbi:MAG: ABC transporter substrate-binding protein [Syntrophales bacterium]|nr:ABC transporter substrate-binding protein [Syntrophales bacterium]MDD4339821.1 ABC transporter substrate-binding protein [Syntrophales bacterium]HOS78367.1 ABC transporter substrate-binding protein [Syntrophales bacterium]HPB70856.1 ABC transporter substrate-binding protein [Syntrophales bacterium]HQP29121.1 ABC transporter substrate-binding protein [Syntrophales bacterium]